MTDVSGERNVHPVGFDDGPEPGSYAEQRRDEDARLRAPSYHTSRELPQAVHEGQFDDCPECSPPASQAAKERDAEIAKGNQGQYYAVSARHGDLISRKNRPLYATLAEWASLDGALPTVAYIPTTVITTVKSHGPLFGSLPLFDTGDTPDIIGRVVELLSFLEKTASMYGDRIVQLDEVVRQVANRPTHERELLRRAAEMLDWDGGGALPTYEQRLDWLAQYRELTAEATP